MTRRELLGMVGKSAVAGGLARFPQPAVTNDHAQARSPAQLPGTEALTAEGDLAAQMVEGIHHFLIQQTAASVEKRSAKWNRDYSSHAAYVESIEPNRERFQQIIGLIDKRLPHPSPTVEVKVGSSSPVIALGEGFRVSSIRWPVLDGVEGEGLLLEPLGTPRARVVALPDADWSPEMLVGLSPGIPPEAQFARRLAENGCMIIIPTLISRGAECSGSERLGIFTNLTHREYIYRMAYEIGRHVIGFEVQKILAVIDWFWECTPSLPLGVIGYAEGGLLALYSAAVDTRIQACCVSGYFTAREGLWQQPIYRNVWSLLQEFGDAELAGMIAPRTLIVEPARGVEIFGPPPATEGRSASAALGRLTSPQISNVRDEIKRVQPIFEKLGIAEHLRLVLNGDGQRAPGSDQGLRAFLGALGAADPLKAPGRTPRDLRVGFDPGARQHRQFKQLVHFTQRAALECESVRKTFWAQADSSSAEKWQQSTAFYRRYLWEEIIGKLPEAPQRVAAETRKIYEQVNWTGYEVLLPLWPQVFAYGILLLPNDIKAGERRPVVVCQHGLENRPQDLIIANAETEHYYHRFAADLADQGFVVYCPQNPYIGGDKFRELLRLAHPLKLSLFSFILSQHQLTLDWLSRQPYVDASRIGLYGLSYGGKTAMRVPPLLERYALSICSGDFNEWIWKVTRDDASFSYLFSPEYDTLEFNLGNTFNYSEMASLMTPRPFMVERGHQDGVSVDSWVAYEYAKVRRHYDLLELPDRTRIEFFNGPHTIHGVGTFEFLHRFLNWGES